MKDRLKTLIRALWSEEMAAFRAAHPDCDSWDAEVKLTRLGLWLQERYARTPEDYRHLDKDRSAARDHLLLE